MNADEYNRMFHKHQLNLVAFKRLMDCDEEVLRLVNAAIADEREACAKVCDGVYHQNIGPQYGEVRHGISACAAAIRARSTT